MALFRLPHLLLSLTFLAAAHTAHAQAPRQEVIDALTRARQAVVGLEVKATPGASSAETLGRHRSGSGVVIGPDGLILTIGYLMLEAENIDVVTHDRRTVPARTVGYDLATGFGLVQPVLPLPGITPAPLGQATSTDAGVPLMAAAGGESEDVTVTQLVNQRPFSGYWEYHIDHALFTSPPMGNHSGAALFNERGELLGIGSLRVGDAGGDQRHLPGNMFVPVDLLRPILDELQRTGSTRVSRRPWLGLSSAVQDGRIHVVRVSSGSPAQAAGIARGDVVLAIDGEQVDSLESFYKKLWARPNPDDEVRLTVLQGTQLRQLTLRGVDRLSTLRRPAGI